MKKVFLVLALTSAMLLTSCSGEKFTEVAKEDQASTIAEVKQKIDSFTFDKGILFNIDFYYSEINSGSSIKNAMLMKMGYSRDENGYFQMYFESTNQYGYAYVYEYGSETGVMGYVDISAKKDNVNATMHIAKEIGNAVIKYSESEWTEMLHRLEMSGDIEKLFFSESSEISSVSISDKGNYKIENNYTETRYTNTVCNCYNEIIIDPEGRIINHNETTTGSSDGYSLDKHQLIALEYDFATKIVSPDNYRPFTELSGKEEETFYNLCDIMGVN